MNEKQHKDIDRTYQKKDLPQTYSKFVTNTSSF